MENRYKIVISNKNLYREIELAPDAKEVKLGTGADCDVRLRKDLFFGQIELAFVKNKDQWSVLCSDNLYLTVGDVRKLMTKALNHGDELTVKYQESNNDVFSLSFMIDFDNGKKRYEREINISNNNSILIGSNSSSSIVLNSQYVKDDQIELSAVNNGLNLVVKKTAYGVYHNGKKVEGKAIIKSGDFFSVSDYVFYYKEQSIWTEIRTDININGLSFVDHPNKNNYPMFSRNTRIKTVLNDEKIEILDPPAKPQKPKNNLVTRLLPSVGMLLASGIMAFMGGAMIIFSAISGGMAIVTAIVGVVQSKKDFQKGSIERINKYNSYISSKKQEIELSRDNERSLRENIYISSETEENMFESFSSNLFDRTINDDDFLHVRLGQGKVEAKQKINFKKQERLEIEDELQQYPEQLFNEYKYIDNAPVICDFKSCNAVGIVGEEGNRFSFLKNIVVDICARQYNTDVRLFFVSSPINSKRVEWLRYLPNVSNSVAGIRNIVCDDESKNLIFEYLYKELTIREQRKKHNDHMVIFLYDEYGFNSHPISKFVDKAKDMSVTFVFFAGSKSDISLGCDYLISAEDSNNALLIDTTDKSNTVAFSYTTISDCTANNIVKMLAPIYTEEISLESTLTKNISLFQLLNIITVDDLDIGKRWENSQVYKSMSAPIGISKSSVVNLDLHDKAHGPHGLVAGTTGSGKSEILQTYILSMATLFNPHEVAFLIIDFKGGGMVNQFKDLPHLLGAITNIDGKEIERSLKYIKAELQKRQRLFAEADVNHIDKYIKKYKAGEVKEPLPHLIIIVDEFAELKAEQPEFMKELISAARIGRSLGVHLILATQKPSGQVNEQIWSNSRFKLCLKVQSQEDSNEVIKSPLAAEIKEPGRAYLQVGNNEIFELFQSAYSGAPENSDDGVVKEFSISSVSTYGKRSVVYSQKKKKADGSTTQLDAIVDYVANYCSNSGVKRLPNICLPSLKDYITASEVSADYTLHNIPLGIYDDPDNQYQGYARFDLCSDNMLIVGSSQTGKTNFLQDIIRMIAEKHSPAMANIYIADFGAMYLKIFENLAHVGGVVTIAESEKFKNLFKLLTEEIQKRKAKFLDCGLSSYTAYVEAGYEDLPQIFFVLDNFSAFKEIYADVYEDQFIYIAREGISCGISVVMTNSSTSGLGYRYLSNFATRIAFKCNDTNEYIALFDWCRIQPKDTAGRMLCKLNKELYEAQSFIAFEGSKEIERSNAVKEFIKVISNRYMNVSARKIPSIPDVLTNKYIDDNFDIALKDYQYPIALDYSNVDVVYLAFKYFNEFCIIGKDSEKKTKSINNIIASLKYSFLTNPFKLYIVDGVERQLKSLSELSFVEKYTIDYSSIGSIFDEIIPEIETRNQLLMEDGIQKSKSAPLILVLINNKETIDYISSSKEIMDVYLKLVKQFKSLGIAFVFSCIDNVAVGYNSSDLLKRFKENRKGIITDNLTDFKFCDIPSNVIRNNKNINSDDVFVLDGSEISRIKLTEGELNV